MPVLTNSTPFAAALEISCDRRGRTCFVAVAAATYCLPQAGRNTDHGLHLCDLQPAVPLQDEYYGDPAGTSLKQEGQLCYTRPGTDIYLRGQAWAPRGRACVESALRFSLADCEITARISGARRWLRGPLGLRPSGPEKFESVPLRYEYCAGGAAEPRNPVGAGAYSSDGQALDQPLPQIEDPRYLLSARSDRTPPVGLGPIGRSWQPRVEFGGTYDDRWRETRAPLWPHDFDERFFQAAHPDLRTAKHLTGGETLQLFGAHPDGGWAFQLPTLRLTISTYYASGTRDHRELRLDAIDLNTDAQTICLLLRATIPAPDGPFSHASSILQAHRKTGP